MHISVFIISCFILTALNGCALASLWWTLKPTHAFLRSSSFSPLAFSRFKMAGLSMFHLSHPSSSRHLIVVEGFACSNKPRSSVVWGFRCHRVTQGKLVLGEEHDKEWFSKPPMTYKNIGWHFPLLRPESPGPPSGARPGGGLNGKCLVAGHSPKRQRGSPLPWAHLL